MGTLIVVVWLIINDFMKHHVAERLPDKVLRDINESQLHPVINEITLAGPMRKGAIRGIAFYLIIRLANMLKFALVIPTVVSARWISMNGNVFRQPQAFE